MQRGGWGPRDGGPTYVDLPPPLFGAGTKVSQRGTSIEASTATNIVSQRGTSIDASRVSGGGGGSGSDCIFVASREGDRSRGHCWASAACCVAVFVASTR